MTEKGMTSSFIMVSVRCATYNHAPYIRQCLDGLVMQQTTFKLEVIVHDDASTDGTTDIVKEYAEKYPDIIKPMYEETNQYSVNLKEMNRRINEKLTGKYVAICEGDDYWTDALKLQKQVDFLEDHPDYSMCYHAVNYVRNGIVIRNDKLCNHECDVSVEQMIQGGGYFCSTNSLCFKRSLYTIYPVFRQIADTSDYPLQIHLALNGRVRFFPNVMGCYRVMTLGGWTERTKREKWPLKHYENMLSWMNELNRETNEKYKDIIYYLITGILFNPMRYGKYPYDKYIELFRKIDSSSLSYTMKFQYYKKKVYLFLIYLSKM